MFGGRNNHNNQDEPRQATAEDIPSPRTLVVNELTIKRDGSEAWEDISYQGHSIQTTEAGGINILRIVFMPGMGPVQQMVVGLPPGRWRRIYENIDLGATS